jgi:hypothetical protein
MSLVQKVLASLVILFCGTTAIAQREDSPNPARDSLKGLRGLVVSVSLSSMDALPDDPTERELQKSIEESLTRAGIKVFNRPWGTSDSYPTFTVSLFFMNFDIFYYQMQVNFALKQEVKLAANPSLKLVSATWDWGGGGMISTFPKRNEIEEIVDHFICDFRKANPDVKGPLPNCGERSPDLPERNQPLGKRPTVMTELDDQLIQAAVFNRLEEVKSLLSKGANVNAHDHADATPLAYAVRSGNRPVGDIAVIELLLEHDANPNISLSCRLTPLMNAIDAGDVKLIRALLDHAADANAATPEGYTALMAASALGSPEAVSLLIKNRANVGARTRAGQTALTLALAHRNRIAAADRRPLANAPYAQISEAELLSRAQNRHDQIIQLLKNAGAATR